MFHSLSRQSSGSTSNFLQPGRVSTETSGEPLLQMASTSSGPGVPSVLPGSSVINSHNSVHPLPSFGTGSSTGHTQSSVSNSVAPLIQTSGTSSLWAARTTSPLHGINEGNSFRKRPRDSEGQPAPSPVGNLPGIPGLALELKPTRCIMGAKFVLIAGFVVLTVASSVATASLFFVRELQHLDAVTSAGEFQALEPIRTLLSNSLQDVRDWQATKFVLLRQTGTGMALADPYTALVQAEVARMRITALYTGSCAFEINHGMTPPPRMECASTVETIDNSGVHHFDLTLTKLVNGTFYEYKLDRDTDQPETTPLSVYPYANISLVPAAYQWMPPHIYTTNLGINRIQIQLFSRQWVGSSEWGFISWVWLENWNSILAGTLPAAPAPTGARLLVVVDAVGHVLASSHDGLLLNAPQLLKLDELNNPVLTDISNGFSDRSSRILQKALEWKVKGESGHWWIHAVPIVTSNATCMATPLILLSVGDASINRDVKSVAGVHYLLVLLGIILLSTVVSLVTALYIMFPTSKVSEALHSITLLLEGVETFRAEEIVSLPCYRHLVFNSRLREVRHIQTSFFRLLNALYCYTTELRQAREAAEASARLKATFLANVSHEIRTPMNGIVASLPLLRATDLSTEQAESIDIIATSAEHLSVLLNDVLDISKLEASSMVIERKPISLEAEARTVGSMLKQTAQEKGIELELLINPSVPSVVLGDPVRIRQVLTNLLANAIKFTHRGSVTCSIKVQTSSNGTEYYQPQPQPLCPPTPGVKSATGLPEPSVKVQIVVKDTGIGIRASAIPGLFKPFQQADASTTREYGGTGLGLSITQGLVQLMGGTVGVKSTPGQGSEFVVTIPFAVPAEPSPLPSSPLKAPVPPSLSIPVAYGWTVRVLLIEDNAVNRRVISRLLEKMNFSCLLAEDGDRGLQAYRAMHSEIDIVFMDCQMPVLDGYDCAKAIRDFERENNLPRKRIIALTAHAFLEDKAKCTQAGMDDYLTKPVAPETLFAVLKQAHRMRNDLGMAEEDGVDGVGFLVGSSGAHSVLLRKRGLSCS